MQVGGIEKLTSGIEQQVAGQRQGEQFKNPRVDFDSTMH